jgi:SAM-dependent methyltransferase
LAKAFPNSTFYGVDYIDQMVVSAAALARHEGVADRCKFFVGDAVSISENPDMLDQYDVVFTDRMLINLNSAELQLETVRKLADRVRPGGQLLILENFAETYAAQNKARGHVGLEPRTPEKFNLFMMSEALKSFGQSIGLHLTAVDDFGSLHDIVLYALVPAINGGKVDYDHPLVAAATELSIGVASERRNAFGAFGQNRLFVFSKPN